MLKNTRWQFYEENSAKTFTATVIHNACVDIVGCGLTKDLGIWNPTYLENNTHNHHCLKQVQEEVHQ